MRFFSYRTALILGIVTVVLIAVAFSGGENPHTISFKTATTTVFWVGEGAGPDNDFIANDQSYWDEAWQAHYGGIDDPICRTGYRPCAFVPNENPFYIALPYAGKGGEPLLKNRWVEVQLGNTSCYGQWEDVGPNNEEDFAYVFGDSDTPVNTFGEKAGLDVSPALRDCLGMHGNAVTVWRLVDTADVPDGPWKTVVTTSPVSWK
jgi:hypothetical protein